MKISYFHQVEGLIKLEPPLAWETLSPPEEVKWTSNRVANASNTTYWSASPPFSLSSIGLGQETLRVPSELTRPVLVVAFAPSSGVENYHQYYIKVTAGPFLICQKPLSHSCIGLHFNRCPVSVVLRKRRMRAFESKLRGRACLMKC